MTIGQGGIIVAKKITTIGSIYFNSGDFLWENSGNQISINITQSTEFGNMAKNFGMYRVTGASISFTKPFAVDIPLSAQEAVMVPPLMWNASIGTSSFTYNAMVLGDTSKEVPATYFGIRTYNVTYRNLQEVTMFKRTIDETTLMFAFEPMVAAQTTSEIHFRFHDVRIEVCVEFSQLL